jgi:hypothetical protein
VFLTEGDTVPARESFYELNLNYLCACSHVEREGKPGDGFFGRSVAALRALGLRVESMGHGDFHLSMVQMASSPPADSSFEVTFSVKDLENSPTRDITA